MQPKLQFPIVSSFLNLYKVILKSTIAGPYCLSVMSVLSVMSSFAFFAFFFTFAHNLNKEKVS
jgi:hypothetical protein